MGKQIIKRETFRSTCSTPNIEVILKSNFSINNRPISYTSIIEMSFPAIENKYLKILEKIKNETSSN